MDKWDIKDEWWGQHGHLRIGFNYAHVKQIDDHPATWQVGHTGEPLYTGTSHTFQDAIKQAEAALGICHA